MEVQIINPREASVTVWALQHEKPSLLPFSRGKKEENKPSALSTLFPGYALGEHQLTLKKFLDLETPHEEQKHLKTWNRTRSTWNQKNRMKER
jgi:hypothetical protein